MSVQRLAYESVKMTFGLGHLVFTAAAEACLETEYQLTRKTGVYNTKTKKMQKLEASDKALFKGYRRVATNETLDEAATKLQEHKNKMLKKMKLNRLKTQ